ncbi:hypothetical protein L1987_12943 [Smallanthus sonchifolius]|uniref:Uncharacterized protein n=1 Tax=Smallanthus sonchifolius TaxID=185202 RepID=A0ACB9JFK7_9ASTR|nr:hypothetical protein L1987_12943 [Smallanthus sonchifolius]
MEGAVSDTAPPSTFETSSAWLIQTMFHSYEVLEALLEGVAMAGLVGVLRQLGDLAEFAAEIFHGLHEEVMVTAARGHGLLTRVQQIESDFRSMERAFLSQTAHSAFFSSSGISWHPNLQTEQNLITKGDIPWFVMDSYEECRGPPRLFLLDKFDVAGAGACLKRYTDPSIYKVEASSYEMMNAEAQRDIKIHRIKKKGSRWKNGDTPEVSQPSHIKLHQLLLEERVQNGTSKPARRVKLKKREIKFPFDTETGKGYMEKLLNTPPEDKLVHEVKMVISPLRFPTTGSEEQEVETFEVKMVNSPLDDIEEKHISVHWDHKDVIEDDNQSDDVASEADKYMDALAIMESEVKTDAEFKAANSDPMIKLDTLSDSNLEQLKSKFSDSQSASDDESSSIKNKITTFSYSDSTTTSPDCMSPRGVNSPHAFGCTEIPFRPRVSPVQLSDNCFEVSDNAVLLADQETNSKESDLSEVSSNNCVDVYSPTKKEEIEIDPEDITASVIVEDNNSNSTLVNSHVKEQSFAEATVSYSSKDETELRDTETVSVDSESQNANVAVCDPDDDKNGHNNLFIPEAEKELNERKPESELTDTKDPIPASVTNDFESNEIKDLASIEEPDENGWVINESSDSLVISPELDSNPSAYYDHSSIQFLDSIHNNGNENESVELGEKRKLSEESVISPESDSIPSVSYDHSNIQNLNGIHRDRNENDVENQSAQFLDSEPDSADSAEAQESKSSKLVDQEGQIDNLEEKVDQLETLDSHNHIEQDPGRTINVKPEEKVVPQPPFDIAESQNVLSSRPEITRLSSTSSLPSIVVNSACDDEMPNGVRPMKIQLPQTPLIDALATHDKNKLRKVSERAMPLFPKEEERDTFLEQIRAKSLKLKPAVQSRPIIQGPTTNLRVAAILEKANAIRQAFAGSDDDEDDNDSWSDS